MPSRAIVGKGFWGESLRMSHTQKAKKCSFEENDMFEKGVWGRGIHQTLNKRFLDSLEK